MFTKAQFIALFARDSKQDNKLLGQLFERIHGESICVQLLYNAFMLGKLTISTLVELATAEITGAASHYTDQLDIIMWRLGCFAVALPYFPTETRNLLCKLLVFAGHFGGTTATAIINH